MKLKRLTERIWVLPFEEERDRPNLGYIQGDHWSMAVDAGHAKAHTALFYQALEDSGLRLPALTVLTHWHWDHTFGMHAVHGLTAANEKTNAHLRFFREKLVREGTAFFLSMHPTIRKEYGENQPVVITLADIVFRDELWIDPGNCPVRIFQAEAPHTDDSTLVYIPSEKTVFLGDAAGGVFPTWEKDMGLCNKLHSALASLDADLFLEGHWYPQTKQEILDDLQKEEDPD